MRFKGQPATYPENAAPAFFGGGAYAGKGSFSTAVTSATVNWRG